MNKQMCILNVLTLNGMTLDIEIQLLFVYVVYVVYLLSLTTGRMY